MTGCLASYRKREGRGGREGEGKEMREARKEALQFRRKASPEPDGAPAPGRPMHPAFLRPFPGSIACCLAAGSYQLAHPGTQRHSMPWSAWEPLLTQRHQPQISHSRGPQQTARPQPKGTADTSLRPGPLSLVTTAAPRTGNKELRPKWWL